MAGSEITAEIAGTVLSVERAAGEQVDVDDTLLIIESMKMEIPVVAPAKGRVARLAVVAGDVVQEGQTLLTMET
jgi:acetyl-CoA carboxylase biotin carboxyl carrier protein